MAIQRNSMSLTETVRAASDTHADWDDHAASGGGSSLVTFHAPEIIFGPGSLREAGFAAGRLGDDNR